MKFSAFYEKIESLGHVPVSFDTLVSLVKLHHVGVGQISIYAVTYATPTHEAHFRLIDMDRTSPYEEEFGDVQIAYCDQLDEHPLDRRYALTKELMHVFDPVDARVDSREKFVNLLKEIQNKPLASDASPAFTSEINTKWMAAICLCPRFYRQQVLERYRSNELQDFDIAQEFRIPEWLVPSLMDDYYEKAFELLMGNY